MRKSWILALSLLVGGCLGVSPDHSEREASAVSDPPTGRGESAVRLVPEVSPAFELALQPVEPNALSLLRGAREEVPAPAVPVEPEEAPDADREAESEQGDEPAEVTYDFPMVDNAKVRYFVDYYTGRGRRFFTRWLERSGRYLPRMQEILAAEGLPRDLAYLAMVESGFNNRAYSWAHAVGPWQFIASTGRMFGLRQSWWYDERRDFEKSTHAAARFLKDLHARFGDWYLALAAYNAGPGKIARAIRRYDTRDFWQLSRGDYLRKETKYYVPKLLAVLQIAKQPHKFGFTDLSYQPPLEFETVTIPGVTDLEVVARLCEVDYETIKRLNPELKRWCTPPGLDTYALRVPEDTRERFLERYADLPAAQRANYKRHQVRGGDTLLALAKRYQIRVQDIVALNDIRNPRALQIGSTLILPLRKGYTRRPLDELEDDYLRTRRRTYTVRSGDSLWKIARRFGVTQKQLRVWNRLGWSNIIRPGQKLAVSASAAPKQTRKRKSEGGKIQYRVESGDTLWEISRRFNVGTRQIMDWNNLSEGHVLRPGDQLTLLVGDGHRG